MKADYSITVNGQNHTQEAANYTLTVFHGDDVTLTVWPKTGSKGIVRCVLTQKNQWEINAYNQVGEKTLTFEIP